MNDLFPKTEPVDLDQYVEGKGLEGLILMLGREEQAIRENSAARATNLLQQISGKSSWNIRRQQTTTWARQDAQISWQHGRSQ